MLDDGNLSTLKRVAWPTIIVVEGPGQPSTEGCPVARESPSSALSSGPHTGTSWCRCCMTASKCSVRCRNLCPEVP